MDPKSVGKDPEYTKYRDDNQNTMKMTAILRSLTQNERRHRGLHSHEGHEHGCGTGGNQANFKQFATIGQGLNFGMVDPKNGTFAGEPTDAQITEMQNTLLAGQAMQMSREGSSSPTSTGRANNL